MNDYDSPAALAEYLHYLDQNPMEYLSYFWWTETYKSRLDPVKYLSGFCQLCAKLNSPEEERRSVDLEKWWWEGSQCKEYDNWWPPKEEKIFFID